MEILKKEKEEENSIEGRNCGEYTRNFWNILHFKNMPMWVVNCSIIFMGSTSKCLLEMSGSQVSQSFRPDSDSGANPRGNSLGVFCRYSGHTMWSTDIIDINNKDITHVSPGMVQMSKVSLRLGIAMTNFVLEQMLPLSQVLQLT